MSQAATSSVRVAVTQAEPCWFDLKGTVAKTNKLIAEAAANGAKLIAFPEVWIPGYPMWIWKYPVRPDLCALYHKNSLAVDSPEMKSICETAKKNNIVVVLGFAENNRGSLYMAQSTISSTGAILITRRKIKPTHMERTIFGDASGGETLWNVADTAVGRVGSLNCWEHIQPLLKYHTLSQVEQIHVALWPPLTPIESEQALYSMSLDGCRALSSVYAIESQSFVLHCGPTMTQAGVEANQTAGAMIMSKPGGGSSCVFAPDGRKITQDIDPQKEGIVYADLDFDAILVSKGFLDLVGHYSRPDLLSLKANTRPNKHVVYHMVEETVQE